MKKAAQHVSVVIFMLLASAPIHCSIGYSGSTDMLPSPGEVLPINGRILVSADGCAVEHAARMKEYQPVLQGANEIVELSVIEAVEFVPNAKNLQLFLVPVRALKPNSHYRLRMLNPPAMDDCLNGAFTIWNTLADIADYESEPLSWTTSNEADHSAPIWKSPPVVKWAGSNQTYPASSPPSEGTRIIVEIPLNNDAFLAMAEITCGSNFAANILHWIHSDNMDFSCGCYYCAIRECAPGEKYRVWITAMDLAGNETRAPRVIEFRIPDPPQPPRYEMDIKITPRIGLISNMTIAPSEMGLKANIEGMVELSAIINPDGTVQDVKVLKGLPLKISDLAAESVKYWAFAPQDASALRTVTVMIKYRIFYPPYEPNWAP